MPEKTGAGGASSRPALPSPRSPKRVAIIHYWLVTMRGGERVIERLLHLFPDADIFTHVYIPENVSDVIRSRPVKTSFIQKLPGAGRHYQKYLPLMPIALEELDLRGYDLVISSESGPAKGVITAPDAMHLCYVHSPMRYLWDHYHDYREAAGPIERMMMPLVFHRLRSWDTTSAARVDRFVANSTFVRQRIAKAWRRESAIVHPPVATSLFRPADAIEDSYLWVGQMVPYKRADLAVDAFNVLKLPLTMVGDGPMAAALRRKAGPNIRFVPRMNFDQLRHAYATSRALVFTAEEDFGIVPVEMMASGRPVLAYGRGGVIDSVIPERTGLFFPEQTVASLIAGVEALEAWMPHFDPAVAVATASEFAPEHFDAGIRAALA
jgi:glycosyltransferase involved in cell wall biosynthesis